MRIISQDGTIDVPYEQAVLSIGGMGSMGGNAIVYVRSKLLDEKPCAFAYYSSEAKAIKAMKMVWKQYLDYTCNYNSKCAVFQFPKDDEMEV